MGCFSHGIRFKQMWRLEAFALKERTRDVFNTVYVKTAAATHLHSRLFLEVMSTVVGDCMLKLTPTTITKHV